MGHRYVAQRWNSWEREHWRTRVAGKTGYINQSDRSSFVIHTWMRSGVSSANNWQFVLQKHHLKSTTTQKILETVNINEIQRGKTEFFLQLSKSTPGVVCRFFVIDPITGGVANKQMIPVFAGTGEMVVSNKWSVYFSSQHRARFPIIFQLVCCIISAP